MCFLSLWMSNLSILTSIQMKGQTFVWKHWTHDGTRHSLVPSWKQWSWLCFNQTVCNLESDSFLKSKGQPWAPQWHQILPTSSWQSLSRKCWVRMNRNTTNDPSSGYASLMMCSSCGHTMKRAWNTLLISATTMLPVPTWNPQSVSPLSTQTHLFRYLTWKWGLKMDISALPSILNR